MSKTTNDSPDSGLPKFMRDAADILEQTGFASEHECKQPVSEMSPETPVRFLICTPTYSAEWEGQLSDLPNVLTNYVNENLPKQPQPEPNPPVYGPQQHSKRGNLVETVAQLALGLLSNRNQLAAARKVIDQLITDVAWLRAQHDEHEQTISVALDHANEALRRVEESEYEIEELQGNFARRFFQKTSFRNLKRKAFRVIGGGAVVNLLGYLKSRL